MPVRIRTLRAFSFIIFVDFLEHLQTFMIFLRNFVIVKAEFFFEISPNVYFYRKNREVWAIKNKLLEKELNL